MVVKKVKSKVGHRFSVTLEWNHNHPVNDLQACNFKDIPPNVVEEYIVVTSESFIDFIATFSCEAFENSEL